MSQQIEKQHITGYDPMGCPMTYDPGVDCHVDYMVKLNVIFHPETGTTEPDESEMVNLTEVIQTYKGQCGMELARKLIAQGVDPATFADDGQHSGDATSPTLQSAQAIANAAIQQQVTVEQIRQALGLPTNAETLDDSTLSTLVEKIIKEKYPNIIQQPNASGEDGGAH